MKPVLVAGSFDGILCRELRFLQEASRLGPVHVLLWSDRAAAAIDGRQPQCPQAERQYVLNAIRYVDQVSICDEPEQVSRLSSRFDLPGGTWVVHVEDDHPQHAAWCRDHAMHYHVLADDLLQVVPQADGPLYQQVTKRTRVLVTGCYDWFHSGHIRFFEEVSQLGELYVVVGHDANIRLLKGEGHPLFPARQRRYIVGSVSFVHRALISSGNGWLDAEPEMQQIQPDIYAVNEDGDRPEKRAYCDSHGIEYRVLKRIPKEGLPRRQSTELRGF